MAHFSQNLKDSIVPMVIGTVILWLWGVKVILKWGPLLP